MLKQEELLDMRKRILSGYEPTEVEIEEILSALQAKRSTATSKGAETSTKKKAAAMPVDLKDLFGKKE